jgi:hypothetical protein
MKPLFVAEDRSELVSNKMKWAPRGSFFDLAFQETEFTLPKSRLMNVFLHDSEMFVATIRCSYQQSQMQTRTER